MASTSKGQTTEESSTETPANTFANDGSFMEMYKQKLKEMENTKNEEKEKTEEKKKNMNLLLQGKRKIPVGRKGGSSKLNNKRKKIKEVGKKEENPDEKSPAWKAYMEEVQRYKEMSCTDDSEHTRPLVK